MMATVGAALKKIAVALLTDKDTLKIIGGIVLGIVVIIVMPIAAVIGIFSGDINIDTDRLHEMIEERRAVMEEQWSEIETAMTDAGFDEIQLQKAQVLYSYALYKYADESDFVDKFVECFAAEQTDEELIAVINAAFGTSITVEEFQNVMASIQDSEDVPEEGS